MTYDVTIVGAGVVGAAIARDLSRYRVRVLCLERAADVSFGTSKANSGIVHAGFHASPGSLKAELAVAGNRLFDDLARDLDFPFERRGELMLAFSEEEVRILERFYGRAHENGVPGVELIGRARVLELEPNLSPDLVGGLYAPTAGVVGSYEYCFALMENAVANGVDLRLDAEVCGIDRREGFHLRTRGGDTYRSRFVVNAAGLYSDVVAGYVGLHDFRIHPRKGEEYLLDRRVGGLVRRVIFPVPTPTSKGMLVIPTVDGPVMVGPTAVEVDDRTDFSTTREGLRAVFEHAQRLVPAIRRTDIITSFVGLRPAATGEDFVIGATRVPGFINAAGIQSPGLTASPAIALRIRDLLSEQGLSLVPDPGFQPVRTRALRVRQLVEERRYAELEALTREDRAYGSVVCRCECVTEAEIVAAVRRGHTTLDGVKFATRAGMGRCQGGFCTSRILEVIRRETGARIADVTKKGRGSEIAPYPVGKGEAGGAA